MFVSDFWKVGTSVSSTNKTELHHIAEILLKVALSKHLCYSLKLHPDIQFLLYSTQLDMLSVKLRPMLNIICKVGYSISYLQTCLTYVHYSLFNHEGSSIVLFSPANILSQYSRVMILVLNYWETCHAKNIGLLRNCVTILIKRGDTPCQEDCAIFGLMRNYVTIFILQVKISSY